jgi:hypothetical protein
MTEPDNIKRKFEKFNEERLKTAAVTFSLEGISRDLKTFIHKKVHFNTKVTEQVMTLFYSAMNADKKNVKDLLNNKSSPLFQLLEHLVVEVKTVNDVLNYIIDGLIAREEVLNNDFDDNVKQSDLLHKQE